MKCSLLAFVPLLVTVLPAQIDVSLLAGMEARAIGPAGMSGRVVAIDAVAADPEIVWVGAATGGLWKSTNGCLTLEPVFDDQPVASIGAIAIFQPSPDIVWIGTGEGNPRNSVSVGNGVYRTLDGGRTFRHLGLDRTERIRRIWVDPRDSDVAFVAALGTSWGENAERGLYTTRDGGQTWGKALYVDERTGCIDVEVDPGNPQKMFASMWDHRRAPWTFRSGGPGSGLHRSLDGGRTWQRLGEKDGLPAGELGRIKVAFAPSNPQIVYALVEAKKSVLLRSEDGGFEFAVVNREDSIAPRPFYYCDLRVDPQDPERIYNLHSAITRSTDGGRSFEQIVGYPEAHPDHHAMWIAPHDPSLIIEGNDGGVSISRDRGASWDFVRQLPLAQFYHLAVDHEVPFNVYGGMQDNGSWRGPSTVWENGGIRNHHWDEVCFGDGFATLPMPDDAMRGYAMSQGGGLVRWDLRTGERHGIRPTGPEGVELRFNWNAGIAQDPFDADTIYYGSQFVHRSADRGASWATISDDLTTNDPEKQKQRDSGGLTYDVTGAESFTSILTIAPSPVARGTLWVGTDDGRLHVTRDGGVSWTSREAHIEGLPAGTWCPHVEASKFDADVAFAVFDNHRRGADWTPYVFRTEDGGASWRSLATPTLRGYCHVIEQDPVDRDLLFLGTEFGLWFSCDGGAAWQPFSHGFPTCPVRALVVHPRDHDLVIGTHGRAAYVLDDVRPLRGLTAKVFDEPLRLFAIPPAHQVRIKQTGASRFPGAGEFRGASRARGAIVTFAANLPGLEHPDPEQREIEVVAEPKPKPKPSEDDAAKDDDDDDADDDKADEGTKAVVEVVDAVGAVVRRFEVDVKRGINRVVWPLNRDAARRPRRGGPDPKASEFRSGGAPALPGTYLLRIVLGEHRAEAAVEVLPDPRDAATAEDRAARDAAIRAVESMLERAAEMTDRLAAIRADLVAVQAKLKRLRQDRDPDADATEDPYAALRQAAEAAMKELDAVADAVFGAEGKQGITRADTFLSDLRRVGSLTSTWAAPSRAERTRLDRGAKVLEAMRERCNAALEGPIQAYAAALRASTLDFAPDTARFD